MAGLDGVLTGAGYLGAAIVATAYLVNQRGWLRSDDWRFPGLNLLGSLLVQLSLLVHLNPPSLVIEVFWSAISFYGMLRALRLRRLARPPGGGA